MPSFTGGSSRAAPDPSGSIPPAQVDAPDAGRLDTPGAMADGLPHVRLSRQPAGPAVQPSGSVPDAAGPGRRHWNQLWIAAWKAQR